MISVWAAVIILLVLLVLSAFFSGAETAFFSLQPETITTFKDDRRRSARRVAALLETPRELLATILFGNLIVNVLFYSISALAAYKLAEAGRSVAAAAVGASGLVAVIVFGEVVPKAAALSFRKSISQLFSGPLMVAYIISRPVRRIVGALVRAMTAVVMRVAPAQRRITREELSMLVDMTSSQGHIPPREGEMIEEVMGLTETRVREVMAPRVDIVAIEEGAGIAELLDLFGRTGRKKIPVYRGDLDHIVGVAHVKNALLVDAAELSAVTVEPLFIPELKTAESLLGQFQKSKAKMAVVVDEYGGTAGVVTLADLVEEIVGPIGDENGEPAMLVDKLADGSYRLAGDISIKEWNELFNVDLENERLSTLGGFVVFLLGHMPRRGDSITYRNVLFTVEEVRKHRIVTLRAEILDDDAPRGAGS
jgi:CBS domain containing-hemolysin-like protein